MANKHTPITTAFSVSIFLLILAMIFYKCFADEEYSSGEIKSGTSAIMAFVICQNHVNMLLKSPASAKYGTASDCVVEIEKNVFRCQGSVDSQNSFGAMLRSHYSVTVKYLGGDELSSNNWSLIEGPTLSER